ncbi:response regulator [Frigoriglobus tundricola]|uniref:Response regulatory domain-containing protein n=1 Tax=Frigoriglobus tundricola TaxID=2774151 RepID=A0A6M5YLZ9_9BACT|nr:response regulator [Frigoriglobus tundricola]QJW94333.1 hypothetical protein FTUN_1853 [Frigoriglobus tundricola]
MSPSTGPTRDDPTTARGARSTARPPGVLIVDDHDDVRNFLGVLSRTHGFAVWLAAGGLEGEAIYRAYSSEIDLILLDVRMPDRDGPDTLVAIRAINPTVPCCFISGHTGHYTEEHLLGLGASALLRKPFRVPELVDHLRRLSAPTGSRDENGCCHTGASGHAAEGHPTRVARRAIEYAEER